MGGSTLAAVVAVLLQASEPHGVLDRWGVELGGGLAFDYYSQANISPDVTGPLWLAEVRLRSPWGLSLGVLGMFGGGSNDSAGDEAVVHRQMIGLDLEYGFPFNIRSSFLPFGRGWLGLGVGGGSTSYGHGDEPYGSTGHVRELFFEFGVDFLLVGHLAIGPFFRAAIGDTTATVYAGLGPGGTLPAVGSPPGRTNYTAINFGVRVLLVL